MRYILLIAVIALASCKKYVEVGNPPTQLTSESVFTSDATATGAMLAVYAQMESQGLAYNMILCTGLTSDEFKNHSTNQNNMDLAANNIAPENTLLSGVWSSLYKYIYQCNLVLEKLENASALTPAVVKQLQGEAKFTRAFCYYYLSQLYGKVPLLLQTDYRDNAVASRTEVKDINAANITDLEMAMQLLDEDYRSATNTVTTERIRPNRSAVQAMLARMYLLTGDWTKAEQAATEIMNRSGVYQLEAISGAFLKASREAIWQWMSIVPRLNTYPGAFLIFNATPGNMSVQPSFLSNYAASDGRLTGWIRTVTANGNTYYGPYKYKVGQNATTITEYTMVIRLAEIHLIAAEAKCRQGNLLGAQSDLNKIRQRAGITLVSGLAAPALMDSIQLERKRELCWEFGDRWINMKRIGVINQVMTAFRPGSWQETDQLYPVPRTELLRNPNMDQNAGY